MSSRVRFVGPIERVLHLRTVPQLEGLSPAELAGLAELGQERFFPRGSILLEEREPPDHFLLIVEGQVELTRAGLIAEMRGPRESVGLLDVLAGREQGLQARAASDVLCLRYDADILQDVFEDNFAIVINLLRNSAAAYLELMPRMPIESTMRGWEEAVSCPTRPLDLVERMVLLRKTPAHHNASLQALAELARQMGETRHESGDLLWRQGEPSGSVRYIVCGRVRCAPEDGGQAFNAGPGFPLGAAESLAHRPRWFTARAEEHVVTLSIDAEILVDLMEDDLEMGLEFLAALSSRILDMTQIIAQSASDGSVR